jgi:3'-phosphoadenosine 5'-phosphosulfate sulfotransferase (PAPS reductase)/FAD synthetase
MSISPYLITEPTCISFSGGRTSAYMLYQVLQANDGLPDQTIVCFANTGKEEEATLRFVQDCSEYWNVHINWVEFRDNEQKFELVDYITASRNGEPFEALILKKKYLPNPVTRFCTIEMKIRAISKFCKFVGMDVSENDAWVGIRADEPRRVAKIGIDRLPLVKAGVTAKHIGEFWQQQPFDLGLPNINGKTMHGNCDLCFLKGGNQVLSLIAEKPDRATWWAKMETLVQSSGQATGQGARFRSDRPSYADMMRFAKDQTDMFTDESIECFCGE